MSFEEPADTRVAWLSGANGALRADFLACATRRRAYEPRDPEPCDISLVPRVVTAGRRRFLGPIVERLVRASIDAALDARQAASAEDDGYSLSWIARRVGRLPRQLVGNVRFDFLPVGDDLKLLEAGWVNVSAIEYAAQAAEALIETVPTLGESFGVARPALGMKRRLDELGVRTLAILVKEIHTPYAENDWELIREVLRPIETVVLAEPDFGALSGRDGRVHVGDMPIDAVYLRALDGPAAFRGAHAARNRDTLTLLLGADVQFLDHPLLLLAEDKDLTFLLERDPGLAGFVPRMRSARGAVGADAARWVLKLRDLHSGEGVFFEADAFDRHSDDPGAILQERLEANRFPVNTVHGHGGTAITDLAVHVSYRYDVAARRVVEAEVAGFFSRFCLEGLRVNLCTGGGIVPVLIEKEDRP